MRRFLIAGHGRFASGLKSALDIIAGETDRVSVIDAYVGENTSIEDEVRAISAQIEAGDELIVFTDLMGGSTTNQVLRNVDLSNVHVIAGTNFPVLIDLVLSHPDTPTVEAIESALLTAREQLVYVNKILNNHTADD
jgi:fructoselysine and glucoselysine-specific PTS system IIA component